MDKALRGGVWIALLASFAYVIFYFTRAAAFPYPLDYGEGPLLDQARSLTRLQNIYLAAPASHYPFRVANYPPLYPTLLAGLIVVFGHGYLTARVVSLLSVGICAALISKIVRASNGSRTASLISAALFSASPYVAYWSPFARVDFVALAFGLSAMAVAIARRPEGSTPIVCIGLALCAALTRQSYLFGVPIAVTAALGTERPRAARAFAVGFAVCCAGAFLALDTATDGSFYFNLVTANENGVDLSNFRTLSGDLVITSLPLLGLALWQASKGGPRRAPDRLACVYFACTILTAALVAKVGASVNYFLELVAAASILAAMAFDRLARTSRPLLAPAVLLGVLCWTLWMDLDRDGPWNVKFNYRSDFAALTTTLRNEPGPILADEKMALLVETGHEIVFQPFELSQLARVQRWDPSPVIADIRAQRFALLLIDDGRMTPAFVVRDRWTSEMLAAIHDAYDGTGTLAGASLYRPKKGRLVSWPQKPAHDR